MTGGEPRKKERKEGERRRSGRRKREKRKRRGQRKLKVELLCFLPGVVGVTEVTVRRGDLVLGLLEVELLDCRHEGERSGSQSGFGSRRGIGGGKRTDSSGSEVKVLSDDIDELLVRLLGGSAAKERGRQGQMWAVSSTTP
jgi:hypothetical protein